VKTTHDTLKPEIERWDDPGDYPSGAGGGPLPSRLFVSWVDGELVVELEDADLEAMEISPDTGVAAWSAAVRDFVADNPEAVKHDVGGLRVVSWIVRRVDGREVTLAVDEFEMSVEDYARS